MEEGRLQQAAARNRKAALADEAVADAQAEQAAREMREASGEAAKQKSTARAEAEHEKSVGQRQRESEHRVASRQAAIQEAAGREAAERRAEDLAGSRLRDAETIAAHADVTEQQAGAQARRLQREAAAADEQVARLRAETHK